MWWIGHLLLRLFLFTGTILMLKVHGNEQWRLVGHLHKLLLALWEISTVIKFILPTQKDYAAVDTFQKRYFALDSRNYSTYCISVYLGTASSLINFVSVKLW